MVARIIWDVVGCMVMATILFAPAAGACPSDCNGDRRVVVSELTLAVSIAHREFALRLCPQADANLDGRVGIDDLIAAVAAAIDRCPTPLPTAAATMTSSSRPTGTATTTSPGTPTATPVFDPQLPPTDTVDLLTWLQRGFYQEWRNSTGSTSDSHERGGAATFARTFINDALYASLACYDVPIHPVGASAVQEVWQPNRDVPSGWSVSHKVLPDSEGGRGWFWYDHFKGSVRTAGRGVAECSSCHEYGGGLGAIDFYASIAPHPSIRPCRGIPESDGGVCTALGLPPLADPYDGQIESSGGSMRPATLYLGRGIFLEGVTFSATGEPGLFNQRYCGSSVPRPVRVALDLTPEHEIDFAYYALPSDDLALRFRGRLRKP